MLARGSDLRVLDLADVDQEALATWIAPGRGRTEGQLARYRPPVWRLDENRIVADVALIVDMNYWGIANDCDARDEIRRRLWDEAEPTIAEVRHRMAWRCRWGWHSWYIASVSLAGHQSSRDWVCDRCRERGLLVERREPRGYFGGSVDRPMGKLQIRILTMEVPA